MQLSVKEAAVLLHVSEKTVYRWIKKQMIPFYRIHEQIRFNRSELLEWATSRHIPVHPDIFPPEESKERSISTLSEALHEGSILYRVEGHDKPSVLRQIVHLMRLQTQIDKEFLYEMLLRRESLGSTGIGNGIAIPHTRNPVIMQIERPSITLCFLEQPIDFQALDGKPVDTLFTLLSPSVRAHLAMLSRLSFVLHNQTFRELLAQQASREQITRGLKLAESNVSHPFALQNNPLDTTMNPLSS